MSTSIILYRSAPPDSAAAAAASPGPRSAAAAKPAAGAVALACGNAGPAAIACGNDACRAALAPSWSSRASRELPRLSAVHSYIKTQSQSQFIKDKRLHVNTRNIQRQLYPCTATEEVD